MIAATVLAIFFVPLFFVVMLRLFKVQRRKIHNDDEPPKSAGPTDESPMTQQPSPPAKPVEITTPVVVEPAAEPTAPVSVIPVRERETPVAPSTVAPPLSPPGNGGSKRIMFRQSPPAGKNP